MVAPALSPAWTSPLREIEQAAQQEAKAADLDMSDPGAGERLKALLVVEVSRWREEYRKGAPVGGHRRS